MLIIFFALMLALVCAGLVAAYFIRPYTSDDVALQNIVANWQQSDRYTIWLSPDTWIIKAPLYLLIGRMLPNSPTALLVTALVLNVIGFGLFFVAYRYFVGRQPSVDEYIPIVWLTTLGLPVYELLINPGLRNVEIGLGFITVMFVARYVTGRCAAGPTGEQTAVRGMRVLAVVLVGGTFIGLLVYNDPLFLYMFVAPLGLALFIRWLWRGKWRETAALAILGAAVPAASQWEAGFARLHFSLVGQGSDARFVTFDQLGSHVYLMFQGLLALFHANFFGAPTIQKHTLGELINFGLLLVIFAAPLIAWVTRQKLAWWQWFVTLQPYFVSLVFLLSNQVADASSVRYLILVPFYGAISFALLAQAITNARVRLFFSAVILASAAFNALPIVKTLAAGYQSPNARDLAIVRMAQHHGLTKGYASYWNSNINTYLSEYETDFIPTTCASDGIHFYKWLVNDALLRRPATQSFYVYDSQATESAACGPSKLKQQFGLPAEVMPVDDHTALYVYDYDITIRLQ